MILLSSGVINDHDIWFSRFSAEVHNKQSTCENILKSTCLYDVHFSVFSTLLGR